MSFICPLVPSLYFYDFVKGEGEAEGGEEALIMSAAATAAALNALIKDATTSRTARQ